MISWIAETASCLEWLQRGHNESGLYRIRIDSGNKELYRTAYCDMNTDGGGWLVLLRRKDGTVDFDQSWDSYLRLIGYLQGEFWFGLANIKDALSSQDQELRVELEDWEGNSAHAKYADFRIRKRNSKYALVVGGYSGTAGDSLSSSNEMAFSTKDSDNDNNNIGNCAKYSNSGWWFNNCFQALLTGPYSHTPQGGRGIIWMDWKGFNYSLKSCEMKMRPRNN